MQVAVFVNKKEVDIIEVFDDYLIVQELKSKQIYIVRYCDLDNLHCTPTSDKMVETSNVISLDYYRKLKNG